MLCLTVFFVRELRLEDDEVNDRSYTDEHELIDEPTNERKKTINGGEPATDPCACHYLLPHGDEGLAGGVAEDAAVVDAEDGLKDRNGDQRGE